MKKVIFGIGILALLGGCASTKPTSSEARATVEDRYKGKIGTATKADFVEDFGTAEWCEQTPGGGETCRFKKALGERWIGPKTDRKSIKLSDEVVAVFGPNGTLRKFDAKSQR